MLVIPLLVHLCMPGLAVRSALGRWESSTLTVERGVDVRQFQRQTVVRARPEDLWDYLSRFENETAWRPELREMRLLEGESGSVGAVYEERLDWEGIVFTFRFRVDELDPPRLIRFSGSENGVSTTVTYGIEAVPDASLLTVSCLLELWGPLVALEPFAAGIVEGWIEPSHERLAAVFAEGRSTSSRPDPTEP